MGSTDSNVIGISGQGGVVLLNKQVLRIFFAVVGRAAAAVRTAEGKEKKKLQNGKRGRGTDRRRWPGERKGMSFDADIVRYLVMVVTLIEKMLARAVRQHRIARRRRIDYLLHYLENNSS